jgi:hypothetical protein
VSSGGEKQLNSPKVLAFLLSNTRNPPRKPIPQAVINWMLPRRHLIPQRLSNLPQHPPSILDHPKFVPNKLI